MKNIAIIGSGSWGVALAVYLANQGKKVKIWSFAKEEADLINNEKKCKFLPNITLPEGIECTLSYEEAIKDSEIILHVTPSKFTRSIVKEYKKFVTNQPIIICSKGFEKDSLKTLDEVIEEEKNYSKDEAKQIGIDNISKELKSQINNEKDIVNEYINTNESEEYIEVEVIYEVLENIGTEEKIAL